MSRLFPRAWKVQVDTLDVSALDIEFKILSTIKPEPNKCALTLYNLNQDHRAQLLKRNRPGADAKKIVGVPVQVEAGYKDNMSVLFRGDLLNLASPFQDVDWKTTLSGTDGGRSYAEARIELQFTNGTPIGNVLKQVAQAMSIGIGNAADFEATAKIEGIGSTLAHGFTASGSAAVIMTRLLDSIGLTWSIQRGALQLMRKGKPLSLSAIEIGPDQLVGSPEASIDASVSLGDPQQFAPGAKKKIAKPPRPKDPGIIKFKTMLIPGIVPGRKINLTSNEFKGGYMLTECEYVGQSWAGPWQAECVGRLYT